MANVKVTVIVPLYGVETFAARCADSLLTQTLGDIEILFVDDCSPDNSAAVIEECIAAHPEFKGRVELIRHTVNKGLPAARNTGLARATGEFVLHCDGDDWMEQDALESLYNIAVSKAADYVWSDWYLTFEESDRLMPQPSYDSVESMLRNGLLGGGMKYNVWNKLVKRELYTRHDISFPDGHSMGEDMTMIMLGAKATSVAHCPKALYHYIRTNNGAFTQSFTQKKIEDIFYNADRTIRFLEKEVPHIVSEKDISWFKLNVKFPFLMTREDDILRIWEERYNEAEAEIGTNPNFGFRSRLLQILAHKKLWLLVKAYNFAFETAYKILYR